MDGKLGPGEFKTYPIVISWYFPNCYLEEGGKKVTDVEGKSVDARPGLKGWRRCGDLTMPAFGRMRAKLRFMWSRSTFRCECAR
jgi:hypothetical protein